MKGIREKISAYLMVFLTIAAACAAGYRLMKIQIVNGGSYLEKSLTVTPETQVIDIPRGEIRDSSGNPLVSNKSCFNVIVDKAFFPTSDDERNRIILRTAEILGKSDCSIIDMLPMSYSMPFTVNDPDGSGAAMRKHIGVQIYATADQCLAAMCDNYGISDGYTDYEKRIIAGVRYTMDKHSFSVSNTYTFAEDIPMNTVIEIKEHSFDLDGIDIVESAVRTYGDGDIIPHLIGTVGAIDAEEYADLKDKGYSIDDSVGKSGIELAMESALRGKRGERTIEMQNGHALSSAVTEEAVPGNTVKLTVDSKYQKNMQTVLENHISWLQNQTSPDAAGTDADAGAIVVLNAKTGALLAAATAPTYNLNDYINSYSEVISQPNSPLTNRAVNGMYRPGSTFKPITATAALNEGIINTSTTVVCNGTYDYWEDYHPKCTGSHGRINVITALRESCNIFFYETGRNLGIDFINDYAHQFGLGEEAGLETGRGITKGYISSPETYQKLGLDWQAGYIVQAAIGQSETAVTPLQMAAAAMTIANKGTRYQTYMVDSVYTYNMEKLLSKTEPVVAAVIPDKTGYTFDTVIEGMKQAADFTEYVYPRPREKDYYTGKYILSDLPYAAAIKTGTPQITSQEDTGSAFIGFYPADDPEIAFAGFIEHGEYSKFMIRQIIECYYDKNITVVPLEKGFVNKEHGEDNSSIVTTAEPNVMTEPEFIETPAVQTTASVTETTAPEASVPETEQSTEDTTETPPETEMLSETETETVSESETITASEELTETETAPPEEITEESGTSPPDETAAETEPPETQAMTETESTSESEAAAEDDTTAETEA